MSYYDSFDCKINCEEFSSVSEDEYNEVMQLLADEHEAQEGLSLWSDESERQATLEQEAFEQEQSSKKDWLNGYSPSVDGDSYAGVAI
jgi:hypothetical protein